MATMDNIHNAQDQIADLQGRLEDAQAMLDKAERVAAAGEAAKERAKQFVGMAALLAVVGIVLLIMSRRQR